MRYDEERHGSGSLRLFIEGRGPKTAIAHALEEWQDWRMAGLDIRDEDCIAYPEDPGTGWRSFAVLWEPPRPWHEMTC